MSVKVHEAFCFDSFMDRLLFFDDFHGDQLQDEWFEAGTGSAVVVDAQTGGIVRLTTGGTTNDVYSIDWQNIRSLLVTKKVSAEFRAKLNQIANTAAKLSLQFDTNEAVLFTYASDIGVNWSIRCRDGGAGPRLDSGIVADTDYHVFRIECFPTGEVHFYIDGVETANSPIVANIPDDAGDYLQPFLWVKTLENATKSMDIDYVYIRQER